MIDLENLVERLSNVSHFKGLPASAIKDIVFAGQVLHYPAKSIICQEGGPAAGIFVLLKGQVHLYKLGLRGQEAIINIIRPVIMFNEVTVIDNKPNPVTAIAVQDCVTWRASYEAYQMLMQHHPAVGIGLLNILAARSRKMLTLYEDLMSRPVLARVAKILVNLSQNEAQSINRYRHSNQQIAALSVTVPEAVSRSIRHLKTKGVIECTRAQIIVLSPQDLMDLALIEPV
jgi:CRP-like cAMP-binding protein